MWLWSQFRSDQAAKMPKVVHNCKAQRAADIVAWADRREAQVQALHHARAEGPIQDARFGRNGPPKASVLCNALKPEGP